MKITSKILSIPPYLSTTWKNISSMHMRPEGNSFTLVVLLQNQVQVEVPHLDKSSIDEIFEAHLRAGEEERLPQLPTDSPFSFALPLTGSGLIDAAEPSFQHTPEQANLPPLQPEILKKIALIAKAFGVEDFGITSKAEVGCNCMHCQLVRAMQSEKEIEEVTEEDLHFRDWEIVQTDENLYSVTNPLDANEKYSVFLGSPIGCTCGSKNCEHIRAVLNS